MKSIQADKIIRNRELVTVHSKHFDETFSIVFVKRDRFNIYGDKGQVFDRADLELIKTE